MLFLAITQINTGYSTLVLRYHFARHSKINVSKKWVINLKVGANVVSKNNDRKYSTRGRHLLSKSHNGVN